MTTTPPVVRSFRPEVVDRLVRAWAAQAGLDGPLEPVAAAVAPDASEAERKAAAREIAAVFGVRRLGDGRFAVSGHPCVAPATPLDVILDVVRAAIEECDRYRREIDPPTAPAPPAGA